PRVNKEETSEFKAALYAIIEEAQPMIVRQVYYQAEVNGLVPKDEQQGYSRVQRALVDMRREGMLPFDWMVDNTRAEQRPYTCTDIADALQDTLSTYRKTLWTDDDAYVQFWVEKDGLASTIAPITTKYDVGLMPARGYSSITALYEEAIKLPTNRQSFI